MSILAEKWHFLCLNNELAKNRKCKYQCEIENTHTNTHVCQCIVGAKIDENYVF